MNTNSIITYKGRTPSGEKISGRFIGNQSDFKRKLQSQGILLLQVKEEKLKLKSGGFKETDFLSGIEQLYYLLNSGMRLDTSLETISDSLQKKSAQYFWITVLEEVKKGTRFSQAIAVGSSEVTGWQVPGLYSRMISIGEEVGEIGGSLKRLLHHMEFRKTMKAEIISSLSYPAFLVVMSVVAIVIVVLVIVPRFATLFQPEQLANLPLVSKIVFSLGDIGSDQGKEIFVLFSLFICGILIFRKKAGVLFKRFSIRFLNWFPITRKPLKHLDLADVYTALGAMLEGGIALHHSLVQAGGVARVPALKYLLAQTATHIKEGQSIHSLWRASNLIPSEDIALVAVGESSANLGKICSQLGTRHMEQFRIVSGGLMSIFEPAMIVFIGCAIGFVVTGILLAVLSMTDVVAM